MKKLLLFTLIIGLPLSVFSKTDKYRLIIVDDPSSKITIAWNQVSGEKPVVYYGKKDRNLNFAKYKFSKKPIKTKVYRGMNNHFVQLDKLNANTKYYFVIKDSEGVSKRFWFKTAPKNNSRLSIIAGGDSRNNREVRKKANTLVSKLKPHVVLFGGDMTNSDNDEQWMNWFDDWQLTTSADGRMIPIVPCRGNHERPGTIHKLFNTPNQNSYFTVTFGNNLLKTYVLNSEISVVGDQLSWLKQNVKEDDGVRYLTAMYHKPMRPHTAFKKEGQNIYQAWADIFFKNKFRLVVDCDSHTCKTTYPIEPTSAEGNDEGFIRNDADGTVYTGEGCWGAPLRPSNDAKSWTRNHGSFSQFKLIFVDKEKIELRTIKVENAYEVETVTNADPFNLPKSLDVFDPPTGAVVTINSK